ncbi:MAG: ABC transporter permease [Kineosporiaceae bacterium]|nr:ABC transporter permease [Kineosporiaceae bacterium]
MPERGHHHGLDALVAAAATAGAARGTAADGTADGSVSATAGAPGPDGAAAGYRGGATLPWSVEIRRQLRRRRTQITLALLVLLPFVLVAAFELGDDSPGGGAPGLVQVATQGAANFTLFILFAATGFLLVVVFALFAGDTVASEASWSSLRYLLASPVPRGVLLRRKLVVALGFSAFSMVLLPVTAFLAGGLFFGWAPIRTPLGTSLGGWDAFGRVALAVVYIGLTLVLVSALAFLLGVWTDAPLGAVGGAVMLVIVANILDAVPALDPWRVALPTHYSYAWLDLLAPEIAWDAMARGVLWSLSYTLVLLTAAWWHFTRKDITS